MYVQAAAKNEVLLEAFRFKAMVKGSVFVITLVKNGLALLFNRKVKRFIKLLKREDGQGKE